MDELNRLIHELREELGMSNEQKTVRVRIAVAVSTKGHWACDGSTFGALVPRDLRDEDKAKYARQNCDGEGHAVYFIEADIPLPVATTIEGKVTT